MSSPIEEQARILVATAGGYLRNTIREPGVTCRVCTTPVFDGFSTCWKCGQGRKEMGWADIVVPLSYAINGQQSGTMMRHYKDNGSSAVRAQHSAVVRRLLYVGLAQHQECIENAVGQVVHRRVAIPSSAGRSGLHPFVAIAQGMRAVAGSPQLVPGGVAVGARDVTASRFAVIPAGTRFDGEHVMVLDDTWTTGSRTQSAAVLLRQLGAVHISVVTVARWIDPNWKDNAKFIRDRLVADFDPKRCPITGMACPHPN
ncbi:phosphoribosyltransferase [Nocardia cyriacigeorgica]